MRFGRSVVVVGLGQSPNRHRRLSRAVVAGWGDVWPSWLAIATTTNALRWIATRWLLVRRMSFLSVESGGRLLARGLHWPHRSEPEPAPETLLLHLDTPTPTAAAAVAS